jgi:hypothetical protein
LAGISRKRGERRTGSNIIRNKRGKEGAENGERISRKVIEHE